MRPVGAAHKLAVVEILERPAIRRLRQEGIDCRLVLQIYGWLAIIAGLNITGTGIRGLPGVPLAYASFIWIIGMAVAAAGCAAWGLALNADPVSRRHGLQLFAIGHVLVGLIVWWEQAAYWEEQGLSVWVAFMPLVTGGVLLLAAMKPTPPADSSDAASGRIRAHYNEHILQIARREERARLARDLHDAVKQQLFVIQTAAATAQTRFDDDPAGAREAVTQVRVAAREATTEMEALLDELQAAPMENTGLVEALKKQCEALELRTGAHVSFEPGTLPAAGSLKPGAHEAIYRVAQEALANVARHARATEVKLSLESSLTQLELRVCDNGAGFGGDAVRRGMGLGNMDARAQEIGGRVSISQRAPGTEVVLSVPLTHPAVRRAWQAAAAFSILVISNLVFYGIRGASSDQPASWLVLGVFGMWMLLRFVAAYWKPWRETWR